MKNLITLLLSLAKWLPLSELMAVLKAAGEWPDFSKPDAVKVWLGKIGIVDPLAAMIVKVFSKPQASAEDVALMSTADEYDVRELVESMAASAGVLDSTSIAAIIQIILSLIAAWRKKKTEPTVV
jgi:hypothetical protein